jgi:hypothetical protein
MKKKVSAAVLAKAGGISRWHFFAEAAFLPVDAG